MNDFLRSECKNIFEELDKAFRYIFKNQFGLIKFCVVPLVLYAFIRYSPFIHKVKIGGVLYDASVLSGYIYHAWPYLTVLFIALIGLFVVRFTIDADQEKKDSLQKMIFTKVEWTYLFRFAALYVASILPMMLKNLIFGAVYNSVQFVEGMRIFQGDVFALFAPQGPMGWIKNPEFQNISFSLKCLIYADVVVTWTMYLIVPYLMIRFLFWVMAAGIGKGIGLKDAWSASKKTALSILVGYFVIGFLYLTVQNIFIHHIYIPFLPSSGPFYEIGLNISKSMRYVSPVLETYFLFISTSVGAALLCRYMRFSGLLDKKV